jgi:hypothetical protein
MAFITGVPKGPYNAKEEAERGAWKKSGLGPFDSQKKTVSEMKAAFDKVAAKKKADIDYSNSLSPSERSKKVDEVLGKVPQDSYMDDDGLKPTKTATKTSAVTIEKASPKKDEPVVISKETVEKAPISKTSMPMPTRKTPASAPTKSKYSMADVDAMIRDADKGRTVSSDALQADIDRYKQTGTLVDNSKFLESGKPEDLPANGLKKGGMTKRPPKPAKKVPPRKFASGGSTSRTSASKRGDGCATKGHTKGKYC